MIPRDCFFLFVIVVSLTRTIIISVCSGVYRSYLSRHFPGQTYTRIYVHANNIVHLLMAHGFMFISIMQLTHLVLHQSTYPSLKINEIMTNQFLLML